MSKFETFAALHVPGDPLILFNAWDVGSAKIIAGAGAKAIATGSWSVAAAHGYGDGEELPLKTAIAAATAIVRAVDLPVSVDLEGGYAAEPNWVGRNFMNLIGAGAIGANFEDRVVRGEGLYPVAEQAARIAMIRMLLGDAFFLNARTDLFLANPPETHDAAKVDEAIARGKAYAEAGASGFFVPGLVDLDLLARVCREVPLPVNAMAFPGAPSAAEFAAAGVARISHGPQPYRLAMAALEDAARTVYAG